MKRLVYDSKGCAIGIMCGTKEQCAKFESIWNDVKKKYGDMPAISYMVNNFKI